MCKNQQNKNKIPLRCINCHKRGTLGGNITYHKLSVCACPHIHMSVVFIVETFTDMWYLLIG